LNVSGEIKSTTDITASSAVRASAVFASNQFTATDGAGYTVFNGTSNPFYVDGSGNTTVQNLTVNGASTTNAITSNSGGIIVKGSGAMFGVFNGLSYPFRADYAGNVTTSDLTVSGKATGLTTYQPMNTNINNLQQVLTVPNSLLPTFTPTDSMVWTSVQNGLYVNSFTTNTNTWDVVENAVARLTLTASGFDMVRTVTTASGQNVAVQVWVKLGTATNFCMTVNNTQAWNTIGGQAFTTANGLTTSGYTLVSFPFTTPSSGSFNWHIGLHAQTGVTQQTAGTVFVYG
jgi:hypothetical protein